jgi:SAM-dependent methyltransferase
MRPGVAHESVTTDRVRGEPVKKAAQFEIRLRCPRCSANLTSLNCAKCGFQLREDDGVIHALPPERTEHYASFARDYERIRIAEGRGSGSDDFYLGLPYRDVSNRNNRQWQIRARTFDYLMQHVLTPILPAGGRILDLGAGNCWMSFRMALVGFRPCAVDLLTNPYDGLGAAKRYRKSLPNLFPRFQAELARLPFQGEQFDAVIFNASFHYSEGIVSAMREALRCAKCGGLVIISDTPWYSCEESGNAMVRERRADFVRRYGTASASLESIEFLTDGRLQAMEESLGVRWRVFSPGYGLRWAMRPLEAKLRHRREPARFRIYITEKTDR